MFACIYGGSVSKSATASPENQTESPLLDLAFTFSPLVEQTTADTVVLDISGQDLLFGSAKHPHQLTNHEEITSARNIASEISRRARQLKLEVDVAVASNPDAAIHLARGCKGITVVAGGEEGLPLGAFGIKDLNCSLAGVETVRAEEIQETFILWGVRTFADLARLPQAGIAERLGQDGVRLQELARGKSKRNLNLVSPPVGFVQSLELEHAVSELEPLSFILSRLLNQLCANLREHALATNELHLSLRLPDKQEHERTITLPVPMQNSKTLLRLLLFEIEAHPPSAPISAVTISATPARPRASQTGLFIPLAPEPEKLEITLARLAKLVGAGNVGSPEPLDTHRPDAFRMNRFRIVDTLRKSANRQSAIGNRQCTMGFRVCRPPWRAEVQTVRGRPVRISARAASAGQVRGRVVCASGPWRASGEWWRADVWARDEWDVAVSDPSSGESEVLCRIYFDLTSEQWFVAGIYD
jgi:protein ImuB